VLRLKKLPSTHPPKLGRIPCTTTLLREQTDEWLVLTTSHFDCAIGFAHLTEDCDTVDAETDSAAGERECLPTKLIVRTVQFGSAEPFSPNYPVSIEPMNNRRATRPLGLVEREYLCSVALERRHPNYVKLPNRRCHMLARSQTQTVPKDHHSLSPLPPARS
jgi:hypothetical protein